MNKHKWFVRLFLGFVKLTGILPAWLFLKPKVILAPGAKRQLPKNCILVSNHESLMDFILYLVIFPLRTIRFLIAEVMYNHGKLMAWFLSGIGGIRVDRNTKSFDFVSHALEVLDDGGTVGVFPQGRLPVKGLDRFPFTVSTAFIALHSDAPVVPVYTDGNYFGKGRNHIIIGKPLDVRQLYEDSRSEKENIAAITEFLRGKVHELNCQLRKEAESA